MSAKSAKEIRVQDTAKVISLAQYRKRFDTSDDDSNPPSPCPFAARPPADRLRIDLRPSSFLYPRGTLELPRKKSVQRAALGHVLAKEA